MNCKAKRLVAIIGVLFLGVFCQCTAKKSEHKNKQTPNVQAVQEISEDWKEYKPQSGRFIVSLPAVPQHAAQMLPVAEGYVRYDMYVAQSRTGATFMINVIDYPPSFDMSGTDSLLEGVMKEMVTGNPKNVLVKSTRDTFLECPSLKFVVQNQEATMKTRVLLKDHTLYVVSVADSSQESVDKKFDQVICSFQIT